MSKLKFLKVVYIKKGNPRENKLIRIDKLNSEQIFDTIINNYPEQFGNQDELCIDLKLDGIEINTLDLQDIIQQYGKCSCFKIEAHTILENDSIQEESTISSINFERNDLLRTSHTEVLLNATTLESYMRSDDEGIQLLNQYKKQNTLSKPHRRLFVKLLTNYLRKTCGNYPKRDEKIAAAKAAITLFPSFKVTGSKHGGIDIFFNPETNSGFLAYKLKNLNNKKRIEDEFGNSKKKLKSDTINIKIQEKKVFKYEDIQFFKNCSAVNSKLDILKHKLEDTLTERIDFIKTTPINFFDYFPFFFYLPELILYDFKLRYEEQADNLLQYWNSYSNKIEKVLELTTGETFEKFGNWNHSIKSFLALIRLLPSTSLGAKSKTIKRLNFEQCIDLFITFKYINNPNDETETCSTPHIVALGQNKTNIIEYCICINKKLIHLPENFTFLQVVDTLFKIFYVFNIDWDTNLWHFYNFLSIYIYKINNCKPTSNLIEVYLRFEQIKTN